MRQHPISPVTEPMQYRAIGLVDAQYVPVDDDTLTRGTLRCKLLRFALCKLARPGHDVHVFDGVLQGFCS